MIELTTSYFSNFYQNINLGEYTFIAINGVDGFNRARRLGDNIKAGYDLRGGQLWSELQKGSKAGSYITKNILDGIDRLTSYRVLSDYPLNVVVAQSAQKALAEYERRKKYLL